MAACRERHWRHAFRPALLGSAGVTLVHLLAKNVAAALLSVSLCGNPGSGANLVNQFLLDRLESPGRFNPKVQDAPDSVGNFNLQ